MLIIASFTRCKGDWRNSHPAFHGLSLLLNMGLLTGVNKEADDDSDIKKANVYYLFGCRDFLRAARTLIM